MGSKLKTATAFAAGVTAGLAGAAAVARLNRLLAPRPLPAMPPPVAEKPLRKYTAGMCGQPTKEGGVCRMPAQCRHHSAPKPTPTPEPEPEAKEPEPEPAPEPQPPPQPQPKPKRRSPTKNTWQAGCGCAQRGMAYETHEPASCVCTSDCPCNAVKPAEFDNYPLPERCGNDDCSTPSFTVSRIQGGAVEVRCGVCGWYKIDL